jgi:hypothetical protein
VEATWALVLSCFIIFVTFDHALFGLFDAFEGYAGIECETCNIIV